MLNSHALLELHFIAIACAGLRYNAQACALTGLLALVQYGGICEAKRLGRNRGRPPPMWEAVAPAASAPAAITPRRGK